MEVAAASTALPLARRAIPLIVIADDDPDILLLVQTRLERFGYQVVTARTGEEALDAILHYRPDVAVLDVRMPGMTGIDVVRHVRSDPDLAALPIILLTASASGADVEVVYEAGATDYIPKPFSPQDLRARVELLLGGG